MAEKRSRSRIQQDRISSPGSRDSEAASPLDVTSQKQKRKHRNMFKDFFSTKEPSTYAFAECQKSTMSQQKNNISVRSKAAASVSTLQLPSHVPKVNSKWDGLPKGPTSRTSSSSTLGFFLSRDRPDSASSQGTSFGRPNKDPCGSLLVESAHSPTRATSAPNEDFWRRQPRATRSAKNSYDHDSFTDANLHGPPYHSARAYGVETKMVFPPGSRFQPLLRSSSSLNHNVGSLRTRSSYPEGLDSSESNDADGKPSVLDSSPSSPQFKEQRSLPDTLVDNVQVQRGALRRSAAQRKLMEKVTPWEDSGFLPPTVAPRVSVVVPKSNKSSTTAKKGGLSPTSLQGG